MTDQVPQGSADQLIAILAAIYRQQGNTELADLLESAEAQFEVLGYDRDNTQISQLSIRVTVERYAAMEPRLADVENGIANKARVAGRNPGTWIEKVEITPTLAPPSPSIESRAAEGGHLWDAGMLRLFLSHVSLHRAAVARLKGELRVYGIDCFVAHVDIEPSREWQLEILRAVASMDAMAALLTSDFHASNWTDQEVGMAIARGVGLLPVRLDVGPYGFMASHQALHGDLSDPPALALAIARALTTNPRTAAAAAEGLTGALENANSFQRAKDIMDLLEVAPVLTYRQLDRITAAITGNDQVEQATRVPQRIESLVERHRARMA